MLSSQRKYIIWHSTAQHSTPHHNTAQHITKQYKHMVEKHSKDYRHLDRNIANRDMLTMEPFGMTLSLYGKSLLETLLVAMAVTGHSRIPSFITMLRYGSWDRCCGVNTARRAPVTPSLSLSVTPPLLTLSLTLPLLFEEIVASSSMRSLLTQSGLRASSMIIHDSW